MGGVYCKLCLLPNLFSVVEKDHIDRLSLQFRTISNVFYMYMKYLTVGKRKGKYPIQSSSRIFHSVAFLGVKIVIIYNIYYDCYNKVIISFALVS